MERQASYSHSQPASCTPGGAGGCTVSSCLGSVEIHRPASHQTHLHLQSVPGGWGTAEATLALLGTSPPGRCDWSTVNLLPAGRVLSVWSLPHSQGDPQLQPSTRRCPGPPSLAPGDSGKPLHRGSHSRQYPREGQGKAVGLEVGSQTQRHHWRTNNSHQDSGTPASPCGERGPGTEQKWLPEGGRRKKHPREPPLSLHKTQTARQTPLPTAALPEALGVAVPHLYW